MLIDIKNNIQHLCFEYFDFFLGMKPSSFLNFKILTKENKFNP